MNDYEGKQEHVRSLDLPRLEVVKNMFVDVEFTSKLESAEINSICPKSGLPDFGQMEFWYTPDKDIIEEKSMKLYLNSYRNVRIFKEFFTANVFKDFVDVCKPKWARIIITWYPRGGIPSTIGLEYSDGVWRGLREI